MASGTILKLKQQRSRDRREQILSAATKLFGERGIDGTSLTDIAAVAKVPLSSIYDYFEDKRALVLEVPEGNFEALYQKTEPLLVKGGDPVEQLRIIFLTNFQYIKDNPSWGRVFFLEIWPSVLAAEPRVKKAVDKYALLYVQLIRQAIRAGSYRRNLDPYTAMSLMMGGMCHLTAVWLLYGRKYDLVKKGKALFTTLHNGFVQRQRYAAAQPRQMQDAQSAAKPVMRRAQSDGFRFTLPIQGMQAALRHIRHPASVRG